jgi:hypothetical protein
MSAGVLTVWLCKLVVVRLVLLRSDFCLSVGNNHYIIFILLYYNIKILHLFRSAADVEVR